MRVDRNTNCCRKSRCGLAVPGTRVRVRSQPGLLKVCSTGQLGTNSVLEQKKHVTRLQCPPEYWNWKYGSKIQYLRAGSEGPAVLLLHGFGVGCYHYERNIPALAQKHRVWAVDLLGQGSSWPDMAAATDGLLFSVDTWTEQLRHFIEENIREPVYVVGNSLGGYLAVTLACNHPELCKGIILLNATPFWSFRPAAPEAGGLWRLLPDGTVPVPEGTKRWIKRLWWEQLRTPAMIRTLIQTVYANKEAADEQLVARIVEATEQPGALDAFASIVFSPKTQLSFDEMLDRVRCRVTMMYGREDPWVKPLWGQRLKRRVPQATYLEITPAGHCPHHEVPTTMNQLIEQWVAASEGGEEPLAVGAERVYREECGREVTVRHLDGSPRTFLERLDQLMWRASRGHRLGSAAGQPLEAADRA